MEVKGLRARQSAETRETLIAVARELFTDPGYASTSIEDIVQRAGVARGALYHHFSGKEALFSAVHDAVQASAVAGVLSAASAAGEPWGAVRAGLAAFLDACVDPSFRRIVIIDSVAVRQRRVSEAGLGAIELPVIRSMLGPLVTAHLPGDVSVEALAFITLGGLYGAALYIAQSAKPRAARRHVDAVLDALVTGLRTSIATG